MLAPQSPALKLSHPDNFLWFLPPFAIPKPWWCVPALPKDRWTCLALFLAYQQTRFDIQIMNTCVSFSSLPWKEEKLTAALILSLPGPSLTWFLPPGIMFPTRATCKVLPFFKVTLTCHLLHACNPLPAWCTPPPSAVSCMAQRLDSGPCVYVCMWVCVMIISSKSLNVGMGA